VGHGAARGVVAAASYEARAFGVRSAMASVTALARCPDLVFVRPRFEAYRAVSRQIQAIFADYADLVEPLSLDEAYLDVTGDRRGLATAWQTAKAIRARIAQETGLTASAGVSYNKFLAKLASDHRKPDGQFAVTPQEGAAFVAGLPVSKFHGVGPRTAEKMRALGIHTGADLAGRTLEELQARFGKAGGWYWAIARGRDDRPVRPDRERKSSGSETTFGADRSEPAQIEAGVLEMADDVWAWCARTGAYGRAVTVKVKWSDFRIVTRSRTFPVPVSAQETLRRSSIDLVRALFPPMLPVRLVGVSVSAFDAPQDGSGQLALALE
jgi:DNA polymerase-4